jgi:hypothetical protein
VNALARRYEWITDKNPPVRLRPERGLPKQKSTKWTDFPTGDDLSNTTWERGWVDFSDARPSVEVHGKISAREYARASAGKKFLTYLLHPEKFQDIDNIKPAIGMIPNLNQGKPGTVVGYALRITWDVPVMLRTKPDSPTNPRGWYEGHGEAWGRGRAGRVLLNVGVVRDREVWSEIVIRPPGRSPGRDWKRIA